MNNEQMPESISAPKQTQELSSTEKFDSDKFIENSRRVGAIALLGFSVLSGAIAYGAHAEATSHNNYAHSAENQANNPEGVERASAYANEKIQEQNYRAGLSGLYAASGLGILSSGLAGGRKEIKISGEKPTDQTKE